ESPLWQRGYGNLSGTDLLDDFDRIDAEVWCDAGAVGDDAAANADHLAVLHAFDWAVFGEPDAAAKFVGLVDGGIAQSPALGEAGVLELAAQLGVVFTVAERTGRLGGLGGGLDAVGASVLIA